MGHNEKDNRQVSNIEVRLQKDVVEEIKIVTPQSDSKIDFHHYALDKDGTYVYDWRNVDKSVNVSPKEHEGFPKKNTPANDMTKDVPNFILNNKNKFLIKIDGQDATYEDLCKTLTKSEMLLKAKGIAATGYQDWNLNSDPAAVANQKTGDIKLFGTSGAKVMFEAIKKLTKNGTVAINKDGEKALDKLASTLDDIEVSVSPSNPNFVQIIQDRNKHGSNYTCFDIQINELAKDNSHAGNLKPPAPTPGKKPVINNHNSHN